MHGFGVSELRQYATRYMELVAAGELLVNTNQRADPSPESIPWRSTWAREN